MIDYETKKHQLHIELDGGKCIYSVNGFTVDREDYLAVLATLNVEALSDIAFALGGDADQGVAHDLSLISEALNPAIDDTFAQKLLGVLDR